MRKIGFLLGIIMILIYTYSVPNVQAETESVINQEIMYDMLIDRYNNGNYELDSQVDIDDPFAYHGGDIEGITKKLDDIQSLGITTIILSPIMENTDNGYHGYWIEDFYQVEEQFGTMEDLQNLVSEAHEREMKVILEFVPNYIATTHPFVEDNSKTEWIDDSIDFNSIDEPWVDHVVKLNQANEEVVSYLIDVAEFWINEANIDGYRIHHADQMLPSFLETFAAQIKEQYPDFYLIADLVEDDNALIYDNPNIDIIENEKLNEAIAEVFKNVDTPVSDIYEVWEESANKNSILYVDDKWTKRYTQVFSENGRNAQTVWQLVMTYMYTTPGVPVIFQGSEIPMYGEFPQNQRLVDFNSGEQDLKEFYTRISSLRQEFPVLQFGDFELVDSDRGMSLFKRTYQDETIYIAINNDSESRIVSINDLESGYQLRGILGDNIVRELDNGEYRIGIDREAAEVFFIEENTGLNWAFILPIVAVFIIFVVAVIYMTKKQKKREQVEGEK
ncbi:alpha-amylase family glycosyl hydrolase [Ornithinibacillus halophilus]|uniref:Alpha-amylase n=1 Tax=Ornithinibacillus halophilus TaxID=930117 RepID=A0A1M5I294_9BACI|nr:alpha-amylase family glycosyl hydrolase [Ornithinibacillus halophilus]SHG22385.1 alpha-amylase [Ornithinibacillus halophilus]